MWYEIGWIFCGAFVGSVITLVLNLIRQDKKDQMTKEYEEFLKRDSNFYKNAFDKMRLSYERLNLTYQQLSERCRIAEQFSDSGVLNSGEIQDVVKYAMKKAHPDNGGTSEEFRKYRDMYNKVTNK